MNQYRPSFFHRTILFVMRLFFGSSVIDVARTAYYRPELIQRNYYHLQQEVLRGKSEWTVGERELMAAFVSARNRCEFCLTAHSGFASAAESPEWVEAILNDELGDEIAPRLRAALMFLDKLTRQPWNLSPDDVGSLRAQNLSDGAIADAVMVCIVFSIGNRLADATGIGVAAQTAVKRVAPIILGMGYKLYAI